MDTLNLLAQVGGAAGLTLLVVQFVIKKAIKNGRYWPLASVVTGVALTLLVTVATGQTGQVALASAGVQGIFSGLVASGVWSGANAVQGR